jgi:hypothetical protein
MEERFGSQSIFVIRPRPEFPQLPVPRYTVVISVLSKRMTRFDSSSNIMPIHGALSVTSRETGEKGSH